MATPKTPRKRAVKAAEVEDAGTIGPVFEPDTTPDETTASPSEVVEDAAVTLDEPQVPEPQSSEPEVVYPVPPEVEAPRDPPPAPVVKSSPGFVPLVLGGVVAAGIGFGLARYVVPEGWPTPGSSPFQAQLAQQAMEIKDLRAQVQAVPKENPALLGEVEQLRITATTALETAEAAKLAAANPVDQSEGLAELTARLTALEARPTDTSTVDLAAIDALQADIATLRAGLEKQQAATEQQSQSAEAALAAVTTEAQSILLQAALTKVEAAMQNGQPFAEPLKLLADAGVTIPPALRNTAENGLPTIAALTESFNAPARAALEDSLRANMGESWSDRVGTFLRTQTGARSLTPQAGNDPDAILSRADAAVAAGDLQTAVDEIATLPEPAQTALAAWVEQVKLRLDAQAATAELSAALSER